MLPIDTTFDVALANELAHYESYNKHLYRPNTYLHKWWARRCGSTFRLLLKHLVEDPDKRGYYSAGGLEGFVVLDPMMGGGTTVHEAIRLGANVIGVDIDPIPVLQARASLTPVALEDLESAFADFLYRLRFHLDPLYETQCPICWRDVPLRFVLYGLKRRCSCGSVLVVDSMCVRREASGKAWQLCPKCHTILQSDRAEHSCSENELPLIQKSQRHCPQCRAAYAEDLSQPFYSRYEPVTVVGDCDDDGPFYVAARPGDLKRIANADRARDALFDLAHFEVYAGPKSDDLLRRGIGSYLDLFSSRQLLYLKRAIELLADCGAHIGLYLALLVSTSLEFNSMLSGYKGSAERRPGAVRHAFAHHAYSFPYMALENNPVYPQRSSGTLEKLFHDRVRRARRWARQPVERAIGRRSSRTVPIRGEMDEGHEVQAIGELGRGSRQFRVQQGSSSKLQIPDASVDFVVTDPPYYDNVQYGDLSAFFRRWLSLLVPDELQEGIDWHYDLGGAAVAHGVIGASSSSAGQYVTNLAAIFAECHRVLRKRSGRLIFTFHHWRPEAWSALTWALKCAGFRLINRYVVHSEHPMSVHIANLKAITDDAVLVLAPQEAGLRQSWSQLARIDLSASEAVCRDCATLLGWMLEANLGEAAIEELWQEAFRPS